MTGLEWIGGGLALAAILSVPGMGFATLFSNGNERTRLAWWLDSAWVGLAINWINVALVRELAVSSDLQLTVLVGLAVLWTAVGGWLACTRPRWVPALPNERLGVGLVCLTVAVFALWKWADLQRPLHGYWYLSGADSGQYEGAAPEPAAGGVERIEGSDSGGYRLELSGGEVELVASSSARGRIAFAMDGPLGATLQVGNKAATVMQSVVERPDEGPVRRYLESGVAGLVVDVDLEAGEALRVQADGTSLYVLPGAESVWAAHASGALRYVHYYQLLNQVENQVWAQEMLEDRWATLNQPPGWSPQLSLATLLIVDDMPAAGALFLLVLLLVGGSAVRLAVVLAPRAPAAALAVPAAMVAAHGLLMVEPGSFNFPDSLFAAAMLSVAAAVAERRTGWIAALAIAAGLSRWPGVIVATIFLLVHGRVLGRTQWLALKRTWQWVVIGAVVAAVGVLSGVLEDLLFILYFETFPEHWHGEYGATRLIPRVPGFYALWTVYTGGGLLLASLAAAFSTPSQSRAGLRWLLLSTGLYSVMLATIDHHPTHYFLPLVGLTGVGVVVAADTVRSRWLRLLIPVLTLTGVVGFLLGGDVGLQPIEDMVVSLDATLNP